jgi:hypothetical protein
MRAIQTSYPLRNGTARLAELRGRIERKTIRTVTRPLHSGGTKAPPKVLDTNASEVKWLPSTRGRQLRQLRLASCAAPIGSGLRLWPSPRIPAPTRRRHGLPLGLALCVPAPDRAEPSQDTEKRAIALLHCWCRAAWCTGNHVQIKLPVISTTTVRDSSSVQEQFKLGHPIPRSKSWPILTDKQRAFCRSYVANGGNASQAAKTAGYLDHGPQG